MGNKSSGQEELRVDADVTLKKVCKRRYLLKKTITYKCIVPMAASSGSFFVLFQSFWARSRSVGKCPVCPHVSALLPLDGFSQNLILETCTKICRGKSKFGLNQVTYSALCMKT